MKALYFHALRPEDRVAVKPHASPAFHAIQYLMGNQTRETMAVAFDAVNHDRPTCFLAYTVKGWGTPIAGHKDNHGGLMNPTQFAAWQKHMPGRNRLRRNAARYRAMTEDILEALVPTRLPKSDRGKEARP